MNKPTPATRKKGNTDYINIFTPIYPRNQHNLRQLRLPQKINTNYNQSSGEHQNTLKEYRTGYEDIYTNLNAEKCSICRNQSYNYRDKFNNGITTYPEDIQGEQAHVKPTATQKTTRKPNPLYVKRTPKPQIAPAQLYHRNEVRTIINHRTQQKDTNHEQRKKPQ
jgi:hypothetical protein